MTGNIAQLIALVSHGNKYLRTGELVLDFYPGNSTFQFCNHVDFRVSSRKRLFLKGSVSVLAYNPEDWFNALNQQGCKLMRFCYRHSKEKSFAPDYMLAGLNGGGGSWLIEAAYETDSVYWTNFWDVSDSVRNDNKIWTITYATDGTKHKSGARQLQLDECGEKLDHALKQISLFAHSKDLDGWRQQFEKAREALCSMNPEAEFYHDDLLAADFHSLESRRVIFAAGKAWVFGGMGSWNDLGFENAEENEVYQKLSAELFEAINAALETALSV